MQVDTISHTGPEVRNARAWSVAQKLESQFVAEMLKAGGLGKTQSSFGGGAGEDQFSSFLVHEYASSFVAAGGIGLSEALYQSIVKSEESA